MSWCAGKSLCIVTGASRGIGREICVALSAKLAPDSVIVAISRDDGKLKSLAAEIAKERVEVVPLKKDLTLPSDGLMSDIIRIAGNLGSFEQYILIHNAGSIGDVSKKCIEHTNFSDVSQYWNLNITSFVTITGHFISEVRKAKPEASVTLINISSLAAIAGIPTFGLYSAGKAAREAFLRVLVTEDPSVKVLSYCPGPVDTDMIKIVAANTADAGVRSFSTDKERLLTPTQTVAKLMATLDAGFVSGARVDFYD